MPIVDVNAGPIYFEDQGAGTPLVFIPGLGGDARAFAVIARHMAAEYRVLAFDPRDAGRSFRAEAPYSTRDMALDITQALDHLGTGPAHVVGHSLGGLVAQELALSRPDLVRSLSLASTHAGASTWRKAVVASWVAMRRLVDAEEFARYSLPWLVAPAFYQQSAQVEGLIRFAGKNQWPQAADAFERQADAAMRHEAKGRLDAIQMPTLVLAGTRDLVNPPEVARELADTIPGARLSFIDQAGHMPHIETGAAFRTEVAAFLKQIA